MTNIITADRAVPGERVKDRSGHRWTVVDQVPADDIDPAAGVVVQTVDADGRVQFFPRQAIFTRED